MSYVKSKSTLSFSCSDVDDVDYDDDIDVHVDVVCLIARWCLICLLITGEFMHFKLDPSATAEFSALPPDLKEKAKPLYVDNPENAPMNDFSIYLMD